MNPNIPYLKLEFQDAKFGCKPQAFLTSQKRLDKNWINFLLVSLDFACYEFESEEELTHGAIFSDETAGSIYIYTLTKNYG